MVELLKSSLQKNLGFFFIVVSLFFIVTNMINMGVCCIGSFFFLPFYVMLFIGILSFIFKDSIIIETLHFSIVFFSATISLCNSYSNGYSTVLYLLSLLILLGYGFYTKQIKLKILISILVLGISFYFCSPMDTICLKIISALNEFAFLFASFYVAFIIFRNSEVDIFRNLAHTQIQLERVKTEIKCFENSQPEYEKCISELLQLSSDEMLLIKDMQQKMHTLQKEGGDDARTN